MNITKDKIEKLYKLNDELISLEERANKESVIAKTDAERKRIKIERDGKKIVVSEKTLWDEVYFSGFNCAGGKILRKKYPKVFEYSEEQQKKANELQGFIFSEFGIDYKKMRFSDIIKVVDAMLEYKQR